MSDYTNLIATENPLAAAYMWVRGVVTNWELIRLVGQDAASWLMGAEIRFGRDWTTAEKLEWIDMLAAEAAVEWRPEPNWQPSVTRILDDPEKVA